MISDMEAAYFLDRTPMVWSMKEIIDKHNFIKMKDFCFVKGCQEYETINDRLGEDVCKRHIW